MNGERFITEELKNLETELLSAKDRVADLEYSIFSDLRQRIAREVLRIQDTARRTAELDVLVSLADCAVSRGWVRPEITDDGIIDIRDGRHPVVELTQNTREVNARFFDSIDDVPTHAVTMGIKSIMHARKIILIALGEAKADAIKAAVEGPVDPACPASVLQLHPDVTFFCDEGAASKLSR